MSFNGPGTHKKGNIAHPLMLHGAASAPFVPAQYIRAQVNCLPSPRLMSTLVLAQTTDTGKFRLQVQRHGTSWKKKGYNS